MRRPQSYRSKQRIVEDWYRYHQFLYGPDERPSLAWLMIYTGIDSRTTVWRCRDDYEAKLRALGVELATCEVDHAGEPLPDDPALWPALVNLLENGRK